MSLLERVFDYLNGCDLAQLDAIMLAAFVFIVGVGMLGSCFVLGHLQACFGAHRGTCLPARRAESSPAVMAADGARATTRQWATIPSPTVHYAAYNVGPAGFGKPRYGPSIQQPGQADAAGTFGF